MTNGGWTLSTQWPITLFPCRLETRFVDAELLIRVIPDDIHADTHEPELTDAETAAGQSYWQQVSGTDDDGTALAAWRSLASQLGPARAAWVARVVRQSVLNQQVPFQPASRPATWTRVPYASLLPTRWTAVGWLGSERAQVTGIEITGPVPAGPDPSEGGQAMPLWMQFFGPAEDVGTAENIGMGLRLPLTADMQQNGLDLLLVYGVDESGDASAGAQALSELFDAHFYSDGFSYMAPGTPTTNTGDVSSGLDQRAQAYTDGYRVQAGDQPATGPQTSAGMLTAALGISPMENADPHAPSLEWQPHIAAAAEALAQAGGSDSTQNWLQAQAAVLGGVATAAGLAANGALTEEATAAAMTSALWAAGLGYFLSQMLTGTEGEDWQRLDHGNVIDEDAYLRYLDRQRLLLQAQAGVIAQETGVLAGEPGTPEFEVAWLAAISQRAQAAGISSDQASQQLVDAYTGQAVAAWQQLRPGDGFDADGDYEGAARDMLHDRNARYAYYRWLARAALGGPPADLRLDDWLARETAALYGDATFRAARDHVVAYLRPGGSVARHRRRQPAVRDPDRYRPRRLGAQPGRGKTAGVRGRAARAARHRLAPLRRQRAANRHRTSHRRRHRHADATGTAGHQPAQPADLRPRAGRPQVRPRLVAVRADEPQH